MSQPGFAVTSKTPLIEGELSHEIIGAAMKVHSVLGPGLLEKVYENALVVELRLRGLAVDQQRRFSVLYESVPVGEYVPDILVEGRIIVDTKTVNVIGDAEKATMIHYVTHSRCPLGLIINFSKPSLEWVRILRPDSRTSQQLLRKRGNPRQSV